MPAVPRGREPRSRGKPPEHWKRSFEPGPDRWAAREVVALSVQPVPRVGRPTDGEVETVPSLEANSGLFLAAVSRLRDAQGVLECWLRGGSMGRAIPAGSRIRIVFVDAHSYRPGQVIAFLTERRMCVHRIVYRGRRRGTRNWLITRGDRCVFPDPPVDVDAVLGPIAEFSREDESWMSPGPPERRHPLTRAVSFTVVAILAGLIEIDGRFAQWLVTKVRLGVRAVRRSSPISRKSVG